ncbi:unnamed protein product [Closterium sp. NIES-65]|nr:unnamed protein product [Closterium sp. NIES-65]
MPNLEPHVRCSPHHFVDRASCLAASPWASTRASSRANESSAADRASSRANDSSAADKQPSHGRDPGSWHGSRRDQVHYTGGAASHKRQGIWRLYTFLGVFTRDRIGPESNSALRLVPSPRYWPIVHFFQCFWRSPSHNLPSPGGFPLLTSLPTSPACEARQREEPSESNSNKANQEKMRCDRLNDRCDAAAVCWVLSILHHHSLSSCCSRSWRGRWRGASWLRADRGSILVDAVRVLAQLRAETSRLRGSAEHMSEQIQELKAEKSELREERARLLANKQQLEDEVRRLCQII